VIKIGDEREKKKKRKKEKRSETIKCLASKGSRMKVKLGWEGERGGGIKGEAPVTKKKHTHP
jgi:hypothetical protein